MNPRLFAVVLLCSSIGYAQQQMEQQIQHRMATPAGQTRDTKPAKVTPEQRELATQLFESADAQAHGMKDAGSRAFALLQLARAYKETGRTKAVAALEEALAATRAMDDDPRSRRVRARLQEQILDQLIPLAPDRVDDFLAQVDNPGREKVLLSLLRYYQGRKQNDKALDTINRIAQEYEIPYGAAADLMSNFTPEQSADVQQLFTSCLASYRDHEHQGIMMGDGDFGNVVAQFHQQLPPALVRQAIDVLLDEARKRAKKEAESSEPTSISLSSSNGAIALSTFYDYRLFQLLPVLRSIDPAEADKLLKERQDVQTLLAKYPDGMGSIAPEMTKPQPQQQGPRRTGPGSNTSMTVSSGGTGRGVGSGGGTASRPSGPGYQGPSPLEMQRMAKLIEDAAQHPQDSIANAATITSPVLQVQTYIGIARETWKKNPSAARMALGKATDGIAQLGSTEQLMSLRGSATLYRRLEDTDNVKKCIEKGIDVAEKMLKTDTNADDPNQAPKAYWPSTGAYRSMLALAAEISSTWAVSLLKDIPDDDIKALSQIAIANALLQTQGGMLEVMHYTKNEGSMMIMQENRADR